MRAIIAPIGGFGNHLRWLMVVSMAHGTFTERFLLDRVYPPGRTWHNWLDYEWYYRRDPALETCVRFSHAVDDASNDHFKLILVCDPWLCLKTYIKFNTSLNTVELPKFIPYIAQHNQRCRSMINDMDHATLIDSSKLWQPELDRQLYDTARVGLDIPDAYDIAATIHDAWYRAHLRAQEEMLRDMRAIFEDRFDMSALNAVG